ncbi:MAG: EAL domain-containing protein [Alphaproteobacteria bacterium]
MRPALRHVLVVAAVVVATGVSAGAAWLGGREVAVDAAMQRLHAYNAGVLRDAHAVVHEAIELLGHVEESALPRCSEAQLTYLRQLVFRARFVRDLGQYADRHLVCTSGLGVLEKPFPEGVPDLITPDDYRIHASTGLLIAPGTQALVVQHGEASAVIDPRALAELETPPLKFVLYLFDPLSEYSVRAGGTADTASADVLAGRLPTRGNGMLTSSGCSPHFYMCVVSRLPIAAALESEPYVPTGFAALGGVAGFGLSLAGVALLRRERAMHVRLLRAARSGELDVEYQPIVDLATRTTVGAEALLRWTDRTGERIGPDVFVALAEERGFVGELTRAAVIRIGEELADTLRQRRDLSISINAAPEDLTGPGLAEALGTHLLARGVAPGQITIEITERDATDRVVAGDVIAQLRRQGFRVTIDDFGTGYSSLGHLHELEVDALKIDKSFTASAGTDSPRAEIAEQVLALARSFDLSVVVEGIETETQAEWFRVRGAPRGQGWLYGRSVPFDLFLARLRHEAEDA